MDVEIEVTSASRKEQKLSETAAAVYVITREDIRRIGATMIPEALRLAPGMDVARIDANKWAVSCRGFNDLFANKMLVLVDGRSVYTPTFAGVWWDSLGVELEDVDRIEVIRGPGAALWGANAVNAIVNIITNPADGSRSISTGLQTGSADIATASSLRVSGPIRDKGGYRVYASQTSYGALDRVDGGPSNDEWDRVSSGMRFDWQSDRRTTVSCQLNTYRGSAHQDLTTNLEFPMFSEVLSDVVSTSGTNLLASWRRNHSETKSSQIQFYMDRARRADKLLYGEALETYDLDYQQRSVLGRHDVLWGLGYRHTRDNVSAGRLVRFRPPHRVQDLFSGFVNDEIALKDGKLRLTLGSKLEHNQFTGLEIQPSVRLLWMLGKHRTIWGAVSRAVRTPSRLERDIVFTWDDIPDGQGGRVKFLAVSSPEFDSEKMVAYELGYRDQPSSNLTIDATLFVNSYAGIRSLRMAEPYADGVDTIYPAYLANCIFGKAYGGELATTWKVRNNWRLSSALSLLRADLSLSPNCDDQRSLENYGGSAPTSQFHVRSYLDLPGNRAFDLTLYACGPLRARGAPGYTRLDGRFSWRTGDGTDISIQITNALNSRHVEFGSYYGETLSQMARGISASIARRF